MTRKPRSTSPRPRSRTLPSPTEEAPTPEAPEGSAEAYERFLAEAMADLPVDIETFRGDPALVFHNVRDGVAAVLAHEKRLRAELPALALDPLKELPALADALLYADGREVAATGKKVDIAGLRTETRQRRRALLTAAEALVAAGLMPVERVNRIKEGSGLVDLAQDCLDLAALFREYRAATKGKTAVTAEQLEAADRVGRTLRNAVKPASGRSRPEAPREVRARDALAHLLRRRHADLWRAGAWIFGPLVDQHVPPLHSRKLPPRPKKNETPPLPSPSPSPVTSV